MISEDKDFARIVEEFRQDKAEQIAKLVSPASTGTLAIAPAPGTLPIAATPAPAEDGKRALWKLGEKCVSGLSGSKRSDTC